MAIFELYMRLRGIADGIGIEGWVLCPVCVSVCNPVHHLGYNVPQIYCFNFRFIVHKNAFIWYFQRNILNCNVIKVWVMRVWHPKLSLTLEARCMRWGMTIKQKFEEYEVVFLVRGDDGCNETQTELTLKEKHTHFMPFDIWLLKLSQQIWRFFFSFANGMKPAKLNHIQSHKPSHRMKWNHTKFWFELIAYCPVPPLSLCFP